jgi:hypothetical protein
MSYSESIVLADLVSKYTSVDSYMEAGFLSHVQCPPYVTIDSDPILRRGFLDIIIYFKLDYDHYSVIQNICGSPVGFETLKRYIESVLEFEPHLFGYLRTSLRYLIVNKGYSDDTTEYNLLPPEKWRKINIQIVKWLYNRMKRLRIRIEYEILLNDIICTSYVQKSLFIFLLRKSDGTKLIDCLKTAIYLDNKYVIESIERKIITPEMSEDKIKYWKKKIEEVHARASYRKK